MAHPAIMKCFLLVLSLLWVGQSAGQSADDQPLATICRAINVRDFGAQGNGISDDGPAISRAINAANGCPVFFPTGTYLVCDTLQLTTWKYYIIGEKGERGANAYAATQSYANSIIKFRPRHAKDPLVDRYNNSPPYNAVIGPFVHENILFDLGEGDGFRFGNPMGGPVTDGGEQRYVFGVAFRHCAIHAAPGIVVENGGRVRRLNTRLISLTKAFETEVEDVSLVGGDTQVFTLGCDKPTFRNIRSQNSFCAFDFNGSGTFRQQHVIDGLEVEGWATVAIRNNGVKLSIVNSSFECDSTFNTVGRLNMKAAFGLKARVESGSNRVILDGPVDGLLFPGYSIVEISSGGNRLYALVAAVDGSTFTVDGSSLRIPWSSGDVTVTRLHGIDVLHVPGPFNTQITNSEVGAAPNVPALVYCLAQGMMVATNVNAVAGVYGDIRSVVVGNVAGGPYAHGQFAFTGCSPLVMADPGHPFVYTENFTDSHGGRLGNLPGADRMPGPGQYETERMLLRKWLISPRLNGTAIDHYNEACVEEVPGDPGTDQRYWAWRVDGSTKYAIGIHDETFPSRGVLSLRFRARSVMNDTNLVIEARGGEVSPVSRVEISTDLRTYSVEFRVPPAWSVKRSEPTMLVFRSNDSGFYLVDAILQEQEPIPVRASSIEIDSAAGNRAGSFTLHGREILVRNDKVTADSVVVITVRKAGSQRMGNPDILLLPGVGFEAKSPSGSIDDSEYNYALIDVK